MGIGWVRVGIGWARGGAGGVGWVQYRKSAAAAVQLALRGEWQPQPPALDAALPRVHPRRRVERPASASAPAPTAASLIVTARWGASLRRGVSLRRGGYSLLCHVRRFLLRLLRALPPPGPPKWRKTWSMSRRRQGALHPTPPYPTQPPPYPPPTRPLTRPQAPTLPESPSLSD